MTNFNLDELEFSDIELKGFDIDLQGLNIDLNFPAIILLSVEPEIYEKYKKEVHNVEQDLLNYINWRIEHHL